MAVAPPLTTSSLIRGTSATGRPRSLEALTGRRRLARATAVGPRRTLRRDRLEALVILAGEQVRPDGVRLLATMLGDDALAMRLVGALDTDTTIFALSDGQREGILVALGDAPPGALVGLHSALLRQRELRVRRAKSQERVHKMQLRQGRAS
jgi:hypothetical protein